MIYEYNNAAWEVAVGSLVINYKCHSGILCRPSSSGHVGGPDQACLRSQTEGQRERGTKRFRVENETSTRMCG